MRGFVVTALLLASSTAYARDTSRYWTGRSEARGAVEDAALAERSARAFVEAHLRELAPGAALDDFVLAANVVHDGKRTVSFWQTWRGMRVREGQLSVVIARDAIFFAQSQAVPFVAISLGPEVADAKEGRVIVAVDGRVRVTEHRVRGTWDEWVALDGSVLVRENRLRDATSTLLYDVPNPRPSMRSALPASEATIDVDGNAVTTALDGAFGFAGAGSVAPSLVGPRVRVDNAAGAPASDALVASDGQPTTWSKANDEAADAQLSAFVHASIAKARAREIVPGLAWIDQQLLVTVNEGGGACNASSTGDDLHFFAGDANCENSARIADVVYHELGHSVHFQSLIPGVGNYNLALSEGLADFFAASITGSSTIGLGYLRTNSLAPVREIDPDGFEKVAPDDLVPSQHQSGLIIAGALWDLRTLLIERHGASDGKTRVDRVFRGVLERAPNISNSYMAALVGDDDNGDLADGTPNKCEIDVAFARHGLAPANTPVTRVGALSRDVFEVSLPITPGTLSCEPAIVGGGLHIDNTIFPIELHPDRVTASLPRTGQTRFALELSFADGSIRHFPENAADPEYTEYVGETREIWCEHFDEDPEWTQSLTGSPSPWAWGTPRGMAGDPVAGFTGTNVLGTQLDGDGRYASIAQTQITTPAIDARNYREVRLQFRRWLVVEDATYDKASVLVNGETVWSNADGDGFLTHQDHEWRFVDYDVTEYASEPITVAWKLESDASRALGGWNIDDVCLVGIGKIAVCGDGVVDEGEECDGELCAADCTFVEDNCCSVGADPRGTALLVLGVIAVIARPRRRSAKHATPAK